MKRWIIESLQHREASLWDATIVDLVTVPLTPSIERLSPRVNHDTNCGIWVMMTGCCNYRNFHMPLFVGVLIMGRLYMCEEEATGNLFHFCSNFLWTQKQSFGKVTLQHPWKCFFAQKPEFLHQPPCYPPIDKRVYCNHGFLIPVQDSSLTKLPPTRAHHSFIPCLVKASYWALWPMLS